MKQNTKLCLFLIAWLLSSYALSSKAQVFPDEGPVGTVIRVEYEPQTIADEVFIGLSKCLILENNTPGLLTALVMPGTTSNRVRVINNTDTLDISDFIVTGQLSTTLPVGTKITAQSLNFPSGGQQQGHSISISDNDSILVVGTVVANGLGEVYIFELKDLNQYDLIQTLTPSDAVSTATGVQFGHSVSVNSNGDVIAIGGNHDNSLRGATWVFRRQGDNYIQDGSKLTGTGAVGAIVQEGYSVSISADGNTIASGARLDDNGTGCVFVYKFDSGSWSQVGDKLVGSNSSGRNTTAGAQGFSVSVSKDGNHIATGNPTDNSNTGSAYVFKSNGLVYEQVGGKITPVDNAGASQFGHAVSITANGTKLFIGGPGDNNSTGAFWIFQNALNQYVQSQSKFINLDTNVGDLFGYSLSSNINGSQLVVGAPDASNFFGKCFSYYFIDSSEPIVTELMAVNAIGNPALGFRTSINSSGSLILSSGLTDDNNTGATWLFTQDIFTNISPTTNINDEIKIAPNPVRDKLILKFASEKSMGVSAVIRDLSGRIVLKIKSLNIKEIDVASLSPGIYFLKISLSSGEERILRFLKY